MYFSFYQGFENRNPAEEGGEGCRMEEGPLDWGVGTEHNYVIPYNHVIIATKLDFMRAISFMTYFTVRHES